MTEEKCARWRRDTSSSFGHTLFSGAPETNYSQSHYHNKPAWFTARQNPPVPFVIYPVFYLFLLIILIHVLQFIYSLLIL